MAKTQAYTESLSGQLRALRQASSLSLQEVAEATGVSEATMSRVERGLREVSAPHLFKLATLFDVDVGSFFHVDQMAMLPGVRSVSRKSAGHAFSTERLNSEMLCSDLRHKKMHPFLNFVDQTSVKDVGGLSAHDGEEYVFVLSGVLALHSSSYEPLLLREGDSIYFDASVPHAYVSATPAGVKFLAICSAAATASDHHE